MPACRGACGQGAQGGATKTTQAALPARWSSAVVGAELGTAYAVLLEGCAAGLQAYHCRLVWTYVKCAGGLVSEACLHKCA